ncbi:MAG: hypothetical protein U1U88_000850 [Lawsonella clevelandensis]
MEDSSQHHPRCCATTPAHQAVNTATAHCTAPVKNCTSSLRVFRLLGQAEDHHRR